MNEEAALLAAIRANPVEDTPRLVYADWLQENGQESRAEFIRTQVAGVDKGGVYHRPRINLKFAVQFMDLFQWCPWEQPAAMEAVRGYPGYLQVSSTSSAVLWRRGFVEGVMLTGGDIARRMSKILYTMPPLREIRLTTWDGEFEPPYLHGVWKDNHGWLKDQLIGAFPHLLWAEYDWQKPGHTTASFRLASRKEP